MKKLSIICALFFICVGLSAQNADYLQKKDFQTEKKKIFENINGVKKSMAAQNKLQDSLNQTQAVLKAEFVKLSDSIKMHSATLKELNEKVEFSQEKTNSFRVYFYVFLFISIVLVLIVFFYLRSVMGRMKAELSEAVEGLKDKTNKEFEKVHSGLAKQAETIIEHNNELKQKWTDLASTFNHQQKENEQYHHEYAGKIQEKFNEILHSTEMMDKSQKEAIHLIEEKLKTRWAATDARLAEISAKLLK